MAFERHKIYYLVISIIMLRPQCIKAQCTLSELPKIDNACVASLQCNQTIKYDMTTWNCIRREDKIYNQNRYYDYGHRYYETRITYASNYKLDVNLNNADDEHDIFETFGDKIKNIRVLEIADGNIVAMPQNVYRLSNAIEIKIRNNLVSAVDLNAFAALTLLTEIDLSKNLISIMEMDTQANFSPSRSITNIDLSKNRLKSIPNTCFSLFTELKHLNLSHNAISSFDILTFEGVLELETLDVSHNMLLEIGNSFTRFMKLKELYLQNNELSKITDYNLNTLLHLQKLNLSSNHIEEFENNTFNSVLQLNYLDISNNTIDTITKTLFEKNSHLQSLFVSNNHISFIEDGAFDGKNITVFNVHDNRLQGSIEKDTFKGVHVLVLDISKGELTSLGNETFKYMCNDLNSLNVSLNKLSSISHSSFSCLESLTILDLSHNQLKEINFDSSNLKKLSIFNVRNNTINKITKKVFDSLVSLKNLDLSFNKITEIEPHSFKGMESIDTLTVAHNPFVNALEQNTFDGMVALKIIDLSYTRTTSFLNESFSGLIALKHINSSFGQLSSIAYNTFVKTGSLQTLDLSHNLLETFHINKTNIIKIEEIYLNDNAIRYITNDTFSGLKLLRMLNLVNNNIQKIEANAYKSTEKLSHLYLSSNPQMIIIDNAFNNLSNLYQVKLDNVKTKFTFQNANVQIANLDLNSCRIRNISELFLFTVKHLQELDLSSNEILTVDKFSFQSMPFLIKLDLSSNRINFIQPGSFKHVNELRHLNLFGNNLQTLQFGVFDGMKALNSVNLSSNALQSFDAKQLPVAINLALDNNAITNINFEDILEHKINELSLGGNPISCKVLAELKTGKYSKKYKEIITTAALDFHSENVDGISCISVPNNNAIILPVANNASYDIRPVFTQFTNAIETLRSSIDLMGNSTSNDKSYELKAGLTDIINSIKTLVAISNETQIKTSDYLLKMEKITNDSQIHLKDLKEQLVNITEQSKDYEINRAVIDTQGNLNNDIRLEMKKMLKEEIDAIREEFGKTFQNLQKRDPMQQSLVTERVIEKEGSNDKILYVIAVSLGIIIVLYVINVAYGYFKRGRRSSSLHSSARPIASDMEME